ncbi:tRNA (adenosine(37)-N6)-threonylcarbamoyltransferase complex dimerization subunit type 1 TsaB [Geotalea sp. SG265]|uniref:tRNA (adenosine(37)-N6)-threonylcarbamoyltransferase complex dimerization subunit type 1 TsaB n=1 Tax=Geotalea sp. SG265 TaxID=2922867 RepID=UPI001FAF8C91
MKLLTIDTSTSTCSVALTLDRRVAGEYLLQLDRTLTNRLLSCIDTLFRDAGMEVGDVDGFAVALGPGSFTGVRVGVATVKGLAMAAGKPVVGFSSLAMLAGNIPWSSFPVCPLFDARKNEVYAGIYRCSSLPEQLAADCVLPPAEFLKTVPGPAVFVGEGAEKYRNLITTAMGADALFAPWHVNQPRASAGALLAAELFAKGKIIPLAELNPTYIRPSEAELAKLQARP